MAKKMTKKDLNKMFANKQSKYVSKTNQQNTNNNKKMGKIIKKTGM